MHNTNFLFDESASKFILKENNQQVGYIDVRIEDSKCFLDKVFVDPQFRGKKYGEVLVKQALKYIEEKNLNPIPICSYAQALMRKI